MMYLKTGVDALDKLMGGGLAVGKPHVVYGKYKVGKSVLSMQIACMCTRSPKYGGLGKRALIYDTEAFWSDDAFQVWYGFFRDRWSDLPKKPMIDIKQLPTIYDTAKELGFEIIIHRKEKKTEPMISFPRKHTGTRIKETEQREDWLERSPMWKLIEKKDYGLIVIDSFSILFKDVFESCQQNYPGRASAERVFLSGLRALAKRKNLVTLTVCHESSRQPWGGESIPYYTKHIFGIFDADKLTKALYGDSEQAEKKKQAYDTWRRVKIAYRYRHPWLPDGETVPIALELNKGFVDVKEVST